MTDDPVQFGDIDPEDAWDDIDPFDVRLELLERILDDLRDHRDERFKIRLVVALALIGRMVDEHRAATVRLERVQAALEALDGED